MRNTLIKVDGVCIKIYAVNASRSLYSILVSARNYPAYTVVLGEVLGNYEAQLK
jgi:hypothetical protein